MVAASKKPTAGKKRPQKVARKKARRPLRKGSESPVLKDLLVTGRRR